MKLKIAAEGTAMWFTAMLSYRRPSLFALDVVEGVQIKAGVDAWPWENRTSRRLTTCHPLLKEGSISGSLDSGRKGAFQPM